MDLSGIGGFLLYQALQPMKVWFEEPKADTPRPQQPKAPRFQDLLNWIAQFNKGVSQSADPVGEAYEP